MAIGDKYLGFPSQFILSVMAPKNMAQNLDLRVVRTSLTSAVGISKGFGKQNTLTFRRCNKTIHVVLPTTPI